MQPFWFFVTIPKALPTVAKELGACTPRARFAGGKAPTNKKLRIYRNNYFLSTFLLFFFPPSLCGLCQKNQKVQVKKQYLIIIITFYVQYIFILKYDISYRLLNIQNIIKNYKLTIFIRL